LYEHALSPHAHITFAFQYTLFMIRYKTVGAFLLVSLLSLSCHKHFTVKSNDYKQYGISNELAADSAVIRYYAPYKQKMESEMNRIIGIASAELTKSSDPETPLGNFFADAVMAEAKKIDPTIDVSFPTTKGGIRNSVPAGNIRVSHIFELMPFDNEIIILKLSGEGMQNLVNYLAASGGQPVSGIRMKVRNKQVYDVTVGGKPLDLKRQYTVVTSDYLANSGDDQSSLANPLERRNTGQLIRTALLDYVEEQTKNGKQITPLTDGRIVVSEQ
jgi:2',3'-cyclic-nucleotide 2'-phosphodiesterase (5'-nucleotidase family)